MDWCTARKPIQCRLDSVMEQVCGWECSKKRTLMCLEGWYHSWVFCKAFLVVSRAHVHLREPGHSFKFVTNSLIVSTCQLMSGWPVLIWQDCFLFLITLFETHGECSCGMTSHYQPRGALPDEHSISPNMQVGWGNMVPQQVVPSGRYESKPHFVVRCFSEVKGSFCIVLTDVLTLYLARSLLNKITK